MKKESVKTEEKQKKPQLWEKGQSGNPNGRPVGTKNFSTLFEKAIKKIAESQNTDEVEIETDLIIKAIAEAKKGKYQYHKDIFDRVYGQSIQKQDLEVKGTLTVEISEAIAKKNGIKP